MRDYLLHFAVLLIEHTNAAVKVELGDSADIPPFHKTEPKLEKLGDTLFYEVSAVGIVFDKLCHDLPPY